MCLGHVYIVLKPVGSARLMFDDDLYYELCVFVTEVCSESRMRSVHGKESRNGREVKIHILEGCIQTSEWFRVIRVFYRSTEGLPELPGGNHGPHGPWERRGDIPQGGGAPPKGSPNRKGRGHGPPFPLPLLSFPLSPSVGRKRWGGGGEYNLSPPLVRPS